MCVVVSEAHPHTSAHIVRSGIFTKCSVRKRWADSKQCTPTASNAPLQQLNPAAKRARSLNPPGSHNRGRRASWKPACPPPAVSALGAPPQAFPPRACPAPCWCPLRLELSFWRCTRPRLRPGPQSTAPLLAAKAPPDRGHLWDPSRGAARTGPWVKRTGSSSGRGACSTVVREGGRGREDDGRAARRTTVLKRIVHLCGVVCWASARGMHARNALPSTRRACMHATRLLPLGPTVCYVRPPVFVRSDGHLGN